MANSSSKCSYPSQSCLIAWQSLRKIIHERATTSFIYPELDAFLLVLGECIITVEISLPLHHLKDTVGVSDVLFKVLLEAFRDST